MTDTTLHMPVSSTEGVAAPVLIFPGFSLLRSASAALYCYRKDSRGQRVTEDLSEPE